MKEKREYISSSAEIMEGEQRLTPEQTAGSKAGYEILKHMTELMDAGIGEEQIKQAAELARDRAVEEYRRLEKSEPWNRVMSTLEDVKTRVSADERLILEGNQKKIKDFVMEWKNELERLKSSPLGQKLSMDRLLYHNTLPADRQIPFLTEGREIRLPAFIAMDEDPRFYLDESLDPQYDPKAREFVSPTKEGLTKVFQAFGAEFPEEIKRTFRPEDELIPTGFDGVSLHLAQQGSRAHAGKRYVLRIVFSPEALDKMMEDHEELNKTEVGQ